MERIKIGVLCPSEIAFRRFMPALKQLDCFEFVGLGAATEKEFGISDSNVVLQSEREKAESFVKEHGGKIFEGYKSLISSEEIQAVYVPLPPALHYKWGKAALEKGKHILLEKPFTTSQKDTTDLIDTASAKGLAVHENYMFAYHSQLDFIKEQMQNGVIGDIRLIRIDFGFPFRGSNDFRYNKALGGGALLDCGGYTIKLASILLGETAIITASQLNSKEGFEVDIYGSATLTNDKGLTAQVSFGMDNSYKCSLEVWGSKGTIYTNRILTAPAGFEPTVTVKTAEEEKIVTLPADDTFKKSIQKFYNCIENDTARKENYKSVKKQSEHIDSFEGRCKNG